MGLQRRPLRRRLNGWDFLAEGYRLTDPRLRRAPDGARAVGPGDRADRQQRVGRHRPHAGQRVRRRGRRPGPRPLPRDLRPEIDRLNERIYATVNDGVYQAGFATSQDAYRRALDRVFETLDELEELLGRRRYLAGDRITEADWRLFPTLVRFDSVYYSHFKCNLRRIVDYPNLWGYTRELYRPAGHRRVHGDGADQAPLLHDARLDQPDRIIPEGPAIDWSAPHGRDHLPASARA